VSLSRPFLRPALPLLLLFFLSASAPTPARAQDDSARVIGSWVGTLDLGAQRLRMVFHIAEEDGKLTATMDSPDQGAAGIPTTTVEFSGKVLTIIIAPIGGEYRGTLRDDATAIDGEWSQGPARLPLMLEPATEAPGVNRPQEPKGPFPYVVEDVSVPTASDRVTLSGTLTLPHGPGPFPGAVLVSGSGPQDRNEALMGHKPFLVLADHLTRRGIAVLRYDDRGVGESTGDFATATSEEFAADALSAVEFLANDARVDPRSVGIIGHSEGGLIAPMTAVRSDAVGFIVLLAGPGLPGRDIIQLQGTLIGEAMKMDPEVMAVSRALRDTLFDIVAAEPDPYRAAHLLREATTRARAGVSEEVRARMDQGVDPEEAVEAMIRQVNSPWFRFFLTYDPRPNLSAVRVPVLALNGTKDLQVPYRVNLHEIGRALEKGGNPDVTIQALEGLNHLFQEAETGTPSEYGSIEETFSPAALETVSAWIVERFAR